MENNKSKRSLAAYLPVLVIFVLAVVCVVLVGLYAFTPAGYINTTETSTQNVGGVTATNYMPILEDDVDWESLSDGERADIARYAVNAAINEAEKDGITTFNVMGLCRPEDQPVFLYSGGDSLSIYVNGEASAIPLKE
ncbi:hypothetical protein FACS1894104_4000 [Actinomycetota bacterium]|nr:hypothetical protein FACS1894104_4000 [Actinomycetota bacterium]